MRDTLALHYPGKKCGKDITLQPKNKCNDGTK
jgi:hypothetical protein